MGTTHTAQGGGHVRVEAEAGAMLLEPGEGQGWQADHGQRGGRWGTGVI